jgi:pimeloyl-ACP methyl ester carboxylesterase
MVVCFSMRQLSLAPLLLLATPTNSYSPNSVREIVDNFRGVYEKLESADIFHPASPTIRFSFVPPNDGSNNEDSIPPVSSAGDTAAFHHVASRYGDEKPLAIYLPGLDGFGISATQQYDELAGKFELWRMTISTTDRSSFQQLVSSVADFIQSLDEHRPITLIGESFGGLLAPAVALRMQSFPGRIQGLVMVNPATSFDETQWSALGPFLASLRHVPGIPNLPTAYSFMGGLALSALVPDRSQFQKIVSILLGVDVGSAGVNDILQATTDSFGILEERLPADVVQLRVGQWLPVGSAVVNPRLKSLNVPTLVIVGEDDSMLPSKQEADRLVAEMPFCSKLVVRGAGHFVLDDRVNLTEAILYSAWDPLNLKKQEARYDPIVDWTLPPPDEVKDVIEQRVEPLRRLASPVFFSTCHQGKRWKGLSKLPSDGPILFVANHQLRK